MEAGGASGHRMGSPRGVPEVSRVHYLPLPVAL